MGFAIVAFIMAGLIPILGILKLCIGFPNDVAFICSMFVIIIVFYICIFIALWGDKGR